MLISQCANWQWASGNDSTNKSYLPAKKQYLFTKGVPSFRRVAAYNLDGEAMVSNEQGDDWVVTHTNVDVAAANKQAKQTQKTSTTTKSTTTAPDNDDDCPDLDDFDYGDLGEADDAAAAPAVTESKIEDDDMECVGAASNLRTYDVSIVYDKYYRTPRVFLTGYSGDGRLLTSDEVQEDVSADHANKTVTIETHPYTALPCLSIHPCQHAHTMMRMLEVMIGEEERMLHLQNEVVKARAKARADRAKDDQEVFKYVAGAEKDGKKTEDKVLTEAEVKQAAIDNVKAKMPVSKYLLLFLKFVATVIPTIDYDNTASIELF